MEPITQAARPASTSALLRHFADLRDGTHGGAKARVNKERLFAAAVPLLDLHARQALEEIDTDLLLGTGEVTGTGVRNSADGGLEAVWALSWPEQQAAGIEPVVIRAYLGREFAHPHLQSGTSVIGRSTSSMRSRRRQSYPPCVRWRPRMSTTWCFISGETFASFRPLSKGSARKQE
jgi:hypothetical protein